MINTRLPDNILDLLPSFLTSSREGVMVFFNKLTRVQFPLVFSQAVNVFWFFQIIVAVIACALQGRYLMQETQPKNWWIRQIDWMFYVSIPYYALELLVTKMSSEYPNYFIHHMFSFLVFLTFLSEKKCYSVASLLPFVPHAFYWLNPIFDYDVEVFCTFLLT
jgi:hypothetical protein